MSKCTVGRKRKWTDERALERIMPLIISDRKLFAVLNEMKVEPVSLKTHSRSRREARTRKRRVSEPLLAARGRRKYHGITLHVANIQLLLQYYMEANSNFRDHVLRGLQSSEKQLLLILYADDCQAGNILAPVS